jgi:hypothetical protein
MHSLIFVEFEKGMIEKSGGFPIHRVPNLGSVDDNRVDRFLPFYNYFHIFPPFAAGLGERPTLDRILS